MLIQAARTRDLLFIRLPASNNKQQQETEWVMESVYFDAGFMP